MRRPFDDPYEEPATEPDLPEPCAICGRPLWSDGLPPARDGDTWVCGDCDQGRNLRSSTSRVLDRRDRPMPNGGNGRLQGVPMPQGEWLYSDRFLMALDAAAKMHAAQRRKGSDIPYVSHLLGPDS